MGALDEGHFKAELENGVKLGCAELGIEEEEPETLAVESAVRVLLQGLGEDINREGIRKTPLRVAKALREGTRGYRQKVNDIVQDALFPEAGLEDGIGLAGGAGGLVIVRDLDLFSYCESCLLPFQVKCHVGYVPSGQRVVGLSKLSRVADVFAKRLQNPQRLADEVCTALHQGIKPSGVAVVLQCLHIHFPNLGSVLLDPDHHHGWVKKLVSSGSGEFENEKADIWDDFFCLLKFRGISLEKARIVDKIDQCWCPSNSKIPSKMMGAAHESGMAVAVSSILRSLGEEDPLRKELMGTPTRFVNWLMNFKNSNLEMKVKNGYSSVAKDDETTLHSELNLSFWSQCEHHLLPFYGVVHIGFFSHKSFDTNRKALLQSIVHYHGFKLQVQERLTRQIAETVSSVFGGDVMVVVEANHVCMVSRGIEKFGSSTATIAVLGQFAVDSALRTKFLRNLPISYSATL